MHIIHIHTLVYELRQSRDNKICHHIHEIGFCLLNASSGCLLIFNSIRNFFSCLASPQKEEAP